MKKVGGSIFILFMILSCIKKEVNLNTIESDSFSPSFAIPIGSAKLQIDRISNKSSRFFEVNPSTGLLELVFSNRIFEFGLSDVFRVPNQTISDNVSMPSAVLSSFNSSSAGSTTSFNTTSTQMITVSGGELMDSIVLQNSSINIAISSTYAHDASILLTIPSLIKNGVAYSKTIPLTYSSTLPVNVVVTDPIDGYTIDFSDLGTANNTIRFNYSIVFTKGSGPALAGDAISFASSISLNQVDKAFGYFGSRTLNRTDSINYDLYGNLLGGTLSFADPRIELNIYNSIGVDFDADLTSISAPSNVINQNMGGPGLTSIPLINKAPSIGDSTITTHQIDNSNTTPTFTTLLNEQPDRFSYSTSIQYNPGGFTKNFVTKDSKLWTDMRLVFPLNGYGDGFVLTDSNETNLENVIGIKSADVDNINLITFRIITENGLPVTANIQAYFLDSNDVVLDSLFSSGIQSLLGSASVNFSVPTSSPNYGRVTSPAKRTIDVTMTGNQYKKLIDQAQRKIIFKAKANTVGASSMNNVKVYPENYLKIKVSAKVDLTVKIK